MMIFQNFCSFMDGTTSCASSDSPSDYFSSIKFHHLECNYHLTNVVDFHRLLPGTLQFHVDIRPSFAQTGLDYNFYVERGSMKKEQRHIVECCSSGKGGRDSISGTVFAFPGTYATLKLYC